MKEICFYPLAEDVIPFKTNTVPNGTYVIRKGKNRRQLFELDLFTKSGPSEPPEVSSIESPVDNDDHNTLPPLLTQLTIPQYRHSIDLALPSPPQHSIHSPR